MDINLTLLQNTEILLLVVSTICIIFKSCNFWKEFNPDLKTLFPTRRTMIVAISAVYLLIPCIINSGSEDVSLFTRSFWLIYTMAFCVSVCHKNFYYGRKLLIEYKIFYCIGSIVLASLYLFTFLGGNYLHDLTLLIRIFIAFVAGRICIYFIVICVKAAKQLKRNWKEIFTSEEQFPVSQSITALVLCGISIVFSWCQFIIASEAIDIAYTIFSILFILVGTIISLHPRKSVKLIPAESNPAVKTVPLSDDMMINLRDKIKKEVEEKQLFLDPNLKRSTLAQNLNVNQSYISYTLSQYFGSFYSYVNTLRIEYAIKYAQEHPKAKQTEIAFSSGFGSVKTYTRVKAQYTKGEL